MHVHVNTCGQSPPLIIRSCPIREHLSFSSSLCSPSPSHSICFHPHSPCCHTFLPIVSLSTKRFIDSPDSPRFCHSLFFHSAIFQPCPLLLILIHISDSLWSMLGIHASSPTETDRCPHSSSTVAESLNSPHKHWSNLRQMRPCRPPSTLSLKAFF